MLSNIEAESADDARRILILLCTTKRPLTVEQLIDGIAVELGEDPKFNKDSRLMNEDDIRHICPGFIEVDVHRKRIIRRTAFKTVRIAHYSVQEYLESDRILTSEIARFFSVRPMQANTEVASIYLAYLMDPELCEALSGGTSAVYTEFPLAEYAVQNWPRHYREGDGSDPRLHRLVMDLFHDDQAAFANWAKLSLGLFDTSQRHKSGILARLSLAARFGLDRIVRVLADKPVPIPRPKDYFGPALVEAARHGHDTSVRLLLSYGGNINYLDPEEGTALYHASRLGRIKLVETLLDHGADIEAQGHGFSTPLYKAAESGHDEVVRLLLDRGADIDSTGSPRTLVEVAASGGFEKVVAMLLDRGADPNRGRTASPLEAAAWHANIGQLLIRRGADIDQAGERLLERAASYGNTWMIRLLLDRGADVNVGKGNTPLEAACYQPRDDVLQLLLDNGADVNGGIVMTPLEAITYGKGELKYVGLILDRGADASLGIKRTPLEVAAKMGHTGIIRLLLARGADAKLGIKRTPLEAAAKKGKTESIQLLLDRGADVNLGVRRTPLEAAAGMKRRTDMIQFLLDRGADVNRGIERTPLEAAAAAFKEDNLRLLLDRGAEVNLGIERTPLEAALTASKEGNVRLLLDRGADVNRGIQMMPLEVAAKGLSIEHIQLLLGRGADVNLGIQKTPLEAAASQVRREHVRFLLDPGAEADLEMAVWEKDRIERARVVRSLLVSNGAGVSGDIDATLLELLAGQDGKALKMVQPDAGGRTETTLSVTAGGQ
jgi:ankyrin repeat protein